MAVAPGGTLYPSRGNGRGGRTTVTNDLPPTNWRSAPEICDGRSRSRRIGSGCETCGSRLPRIARIEGRSAEAFRITAADGRQRPLPGVLFHDAIDHLAHVREWRATQTEPHRIRLELEFLPGGHGDIDVPALVARLRASGLPEQVRVDVEPAHGLGPDPLTGKFRRVITHVKAGTGAAFPDGIA